MSRDYVPDCWVVLELGNSTQTIRKVFAGWYGGFTQGDSWKLNSGITETHFVDGWWEFLGHSGSVYRCHPNNYHMSSLMQSIYSNWLKQAEEQDIKIRILDLAEVVES